MYHYKYKCEPKGTCSDTQAFGTPTPQGSGRSSNSGEGNIQKAVMEAIKAGKGRAFVYKTFASYAERCHAWVDKAFILYTPKRCWMPAVYYLWGSAGTQKTTLARAICGAEHVYVKPDAERWFSSYDGQDVVILEDLRKADYTWLLKMLDRSAAFEVEIKGGYVPLLAKVIVIMAPIPHCWMWAELGGHSNDNIVQMTRRLNYGSLPGPGETACNEYCLDNMTVVEKNALLDRMRQDLHMLRDPANWDKPLFSEWDGVSPIPHLDSIPLREECKETYGDQIVPAELPPDVPILPEQLPVDDSTVCDQPAKRLRVCPLFASDA